MERRTNFLIVAGEWWEERKTRRQLENVSTLDNRGRRWLPTYGNALFTVVFTLVAITGLLWAQSAGALPLAAPSAASTGTIAYQGRLADTAGEPLTGTYNMTFRLYGAASGGAPLWEETWSGANSVQVSDGLFSVMLGSLAQIPASVVTATSSLFLGITVGTDSEMSPRVQLGSVPFAVQALTVPDGSITRAKLAGDINLTPADGSITTAKLADGAVTSEKLARKVTKLSPSGQVSMPTANVAYDVLAATLVLSHETVVTIHASASPQNGADGFMQTFVEIDGTRIIESHKWQKGGIGEQHMLSTVLLLGAGQHVVKLRASSWLNNSAVNGDVRTQMVIIEG